VRVLILASSISDNTPNGYYWTFLFPMLLFIAIAVVLYLLFSRPHQRIPARGIQFSGVSRTGAVPSYTHGATAVSAAPAPAAEAGSAAEPEASEGEQAEGDAESAGDAESSE
jgi:hypothetical protein